LKHSMRSKSPYRRRGAEACMNVLEAVRGEGGSEARLQIDDRLNCF